VNDDLLSDGSAHKEKPQVGRRTRGPEPREVAGQLVYAEGRMALIGIKELKGLDQASLVRLTEPGERLEELRREAERRKIRDGSAFVR
jgi:hypothetical protein